MSDKKVEDEAKVEFLDPREEMDIVNCKWDGDPKTQTCWLGEQPGPG